MYQSAEKEIRGIFMSNGKKKIGLVTNWYPTKDNPYQGIFFKEQAIALEEYFDFTVVHYKEKRNVSLFEYIIKVLQNKTFSVSLINNEKNTEEYDVTVIFPKITIYIDKLNSLYEKITKKNCMEGVSVYISKSYQKRKRKMLTRVFKQYFLNSIDVLYCVDAQGESSTLQYISEALDIPYVISEHAPFLYPGRGLKDIEKLAMEKADLFMAISYDKIRQILMQNVKLKRIAYVGNMVDEKQFLLRSGNNDKKTFVMVAANSFYKNYNLFIDIFERLIEITDVPFKVLVVGYGANKGYSKNVEELEQKICNSKFGYCVELIPEVSHDKIQEVYSRADAFVMTSIQEGMPVSALEAGCSGLPIFSTMCGGVEDYVTDEIGRIYKIIDSESFAHGLKEYLEEKIVFDSEYIRKYIIDRYGKDAFVHRMKTCFDEVISSAENSVRNN